MKKRIHDLLFDNAIDIQERLFFFISVIGTLFCLILFLTGFWLEESYIEQLVLAFCMIAFSIIIVFSCKYHRTQMGGLLISSLFSFLLLPVTFFTCGGLYGGAPIWFNIGFVYTCLVLKGILRIVMLSLEGLTIVVCYYVSFLHPRFVIQHTLTTAYLDSAVSVIMLGVMLSFLMVFQNRIYQKENIIVKEQKKEIEELNRAQNRFFSSMSHEIRTPINTIIGLNEMTLRGDVSQEIAENAVNIQGASNMLLTLINDILDMSKIESGKMDIIPVNYEIGEMIGEIVNIIWVRAKEKNLELRIDAAPSLPALLCGDEIRIKQILINLLNNAIKYTSEGSVELSIRSEKTEGDFTNIIFSVSDTGMGIKKETIPYLFDAFQRVDEKKNRRIEGTGLGLSIVKNLVDLMGGTISVNSVYTKGSVFVVSIPQKAVGDRLLGVLNVETRSVLKSREAYKQSFEAPEAKILIVDDNEMNLQVARRLLESTKVQIDMAMSGAECLEKTQNVHYHGILMDHLMPHMDGIETLKEIREQKGGMSKDTPVIVLTANTGSDSQKIYRKTGFDGYLAKPINGTLLEAAVLKMLPEELIVERNQEKSQADIEEKIMFHSSRERVPILISTESVCDLPDELLRQYNIKVLPYYVCTSQGHFLDGEEIASDALVEYLLDNPGDEHIYSEEPENKDYENFFAECLTRADCVIHISMASKSGEGYNRAEQVSREFGDVDVVDCGHLSSGMGLIVLEAAQMVQEGATREEILLRIQKLKKEISTSFIVESTQTLRNVGRISPVIHKLCQTILIHPVICLKNSKMKVKKVYFGCQQNSILKYIRRTLGHENNIDSGTLFITYVGLSEETLQLIQEEALKLVPFQKVYIKKASAVISSNCGPGTFGLLYKKKS